MQCTQCCFKGYVFAVILLSCLSIALTGFTLGRTHPANRDATPESIFTKRLAFASCTQRHMGENPIWEKVRCCTITCRCSFILHASTAQPRCSGACGVWCLEAGLYP